jgi:hypothetical protein
MRFSDCSASPAKRSSTAIPAPRPLFMSSMAGRVRIPRFPCSTSRSHSEIPVNPGETSGRAPGASAYLSRNAVGPLFSLHGLRRKARFERRQFVAETLRQADIKLWTTSTDPASSC